MPRKKKKIEWERIVRSTAGGGGGEIGLEANRAVVHGRMHGMYVCMDRDAGLREYVKSGVSLSDR